MDRARHPGWVIRHLQRGDAPRCCAIIAACLPAMLGLNEPARRLISAKNTPEALWVELSPGYTVVYEQHDDVVGLGSLSDDEIRRLYVHPLCQGQGIGREIVAHLEAHAHALGLKRLRLQSSPSAEAFWAACGYAPVRAEHLVHGEAEFQVILMIKELGEPATSNGRADPNSDARPA